MPQHNNILAPEVGFEPTTNRLTADRSTTELLWMVLRPIERLNFAYAAFCGKSELREREQFAELFVGSTESRPTGKRKLVAGARFELATFRL
jgi:hypothetical protein